jgi:putative peptidoglycan lipid II flippase
MEAIRQWVRWSNVSTNRKIFSATLIIASLTFGTKLVSTGKELVVAASFGTGEAIDAFFIAFIVPSLAITVISGSFNAAFIPTYIQVREREGKDAAQRLLSNVLAWSTALLSAATIGMILTAPYYLPFLASGFSPEKILETRRLLYLLSPIVIITGINTIWSAVLNAGEQFALVAITPALTPCVITICLVAGRSWGITGLIVGTILGMALEAGVIGGSLLRKKISPWPRWHGTDAHLKQILRQYLPTISGSFILASTALINQGMAAMLGSGSVAILNYGSKLIAVPTSIGTTALGTAVIPYFSTMVAKNDWAGIRHTLRRYFGLIFGATIPLTIVLALGSESLVRIVYQRGAFTPDDTQLVARVLALFALQLPFYAAGILLVRLISAMLANHILMIANIISVFLSFALNFLFMKKLGVAGIALSTSCVYLVSFLFLLFSWRWMSKHHR